MARKLTLHIEALEDRSVPAVTATLFQGTLGVTGTVGPDKVTILESNGRLSVVGAKIRVGAQLFSSIPSAWANRVYAATNSGNDVINVSTVTKKATLIGAGGHDSIIGGLGNDDLYGRDGNDTISGGPGADLLFGENGFDTIRGDDGNDSLYAGLGDDSLDGGAGNDILYLEAGNDSGSGGTGNDRLLGNVGNDTLSGGSGNDEVRGEDGDDLLHGDDGDDRVAGEAGVDSVFGDLGSDFVTGGWLPDVIEAGTGSDTIVGGSGDGDDPGEIPSGGSTTGTVQQVVRASWPEGSTNDIIVRNTGNGTMNGWTVEFDADFQVTEVWNAQLVSHVGSRYTFKNISGHWATTVQPNAQITFGFNVRMGLTDSPSIRNIELNDQALSGGGIPAPAPNPDARGAVTPAVRAQWPDGATLDMTIRNIGTGNIVGWTITFDADFDITQVWNAQLVGRSGNTYTIRSLPGHWAATVRPGTPVEFGFNARLIPGETTAIRNLTLNGNAV